MALDRPVHAPEATAKVGFNKIGAVGFVLVVQPGLPSDFTLTLDATELLSSDANASDQGGSVQYHWSGTTDPNWANGTMVDIELGILIDICDRSSVVANAIVAATASFDYCHMISPVDMAAITELDLSGKSGYGLKLSDFAGAAQPGDTEHKRLLPERP